MTELIIYGLLILLILACLVIAKQNEMLHWAMPIVKEYLDERCGDEE